MCVLKPLKISDTLHRDNLQHRTICKALGKYGIGK